MKILQICPDFYPFVVGGGPLTFSTLAKSWTAAGHSVQVLASAPMGELSSVDNLESKLFDINFFGLCNVPLGLSLLKYFSPMKVSDYRRFKRALKSLSISSDLIIVHGELETLSRISLRSLRRHRNKVVVTHHGTPKAEYSTLLSLCARFSYMLLARIFLSAYENYVVYSKKSYEELLELLIRPTNSTISMLTSGLDSKTFIIQYELSMKNCSTNSFRFPWLYDSSSPFVLAVGRLAFNKGYDVLIAAFERIGKENPNLKLIIAGSDGGAMKYLRDQISQLNLEDRCLLIGSISEAEKISLMVKSSVFVIPSYSEGFGLNAVEATALNVKTIATSTGEHRAILCDNPKSMIVEVGEMLELADAIKKMIVQSPNQWELRQDVLQKYDLSRLAEGYLRLSLSNKP